MASGYLASIREELRKWYDEATSTLVPLTSDEATTRAAIQRLEVKSWEIVERALKQSYLNGQQAGAAVPTPKTALPVHMLYLRPAKSPSICPVVDVVTMKMAAAFRASHTTGVNFRGWHTCSCGARSSNTDYILPSGHQTNSLCVHYLAYHRVEVPAIELEIIAAFDAVPVEPTPGELVTPDLRCR